eukprot:229718_1
MKFRIIVDGVGLYEDRSLTQETFSVQLQNGDIINGEYIDSKVIFLNKHKLYISAMDAVVSDYNMDTKKRKKNRKKDKISTPKLWTAIVCRGLFGAAATFTYFESADLIPIGNTTTLISLSCISASFFGWMFLGDEITRN